eukprot:gene25420-31878_t
MYGAQGGSNGGYLGGNGGRVTATFTISVTGDTFYYNIGAAPAPGLDGGNLAGGYNGGGTNGNPHGSPGGGATDLKNSGRQVALVGFQVAGIQPEQINLVWRVVSAVHKVRQGKHIVQQAVVRNVVNQAQMESVVRATVAVEEAVITEVVEAAVVEAGALVTFIPQAMRLPYKMWLETSMSMFDSGQLMSRV